MSKNPNFCFQDETMAIGNKSLEPAGPFDENANATKQLLKKPIS